MVGIAAGAGSGPAQTRGVPRGHAGLQQSLTCLQCSRLSLGRSYGKRSGNQGIVQTMANRADDWDTKGSNSDCESPPSTTGLIPSGDGRRALVSRITRESRGDSSDDSQRSNLGR